MSQPPAAGPPAAAPRRSGIAEDGLVAGVIGGLTVALFFLVVDALNGRPLYTPSLLGSVLFLGLDAGRHAGVDVPMMFAYTGVHMAAFVAAGMAGAWGVRQFEANPPLGAILLILFVCFEVGFIAFTWAFMPGVVGALGAWLVGIANLLSAGAMALYLLRAHPGAIKSLEHVWDDA